MIDELLKVGGAKFLVPCVFAAVIVALAKGLFGIHQFKRTSRKDFLDLWVHNNDHDDLWQQTAIRHLFGAWLPMPVIRRLMVSPESGNALVDICGAWGFLEFDENTQVVNWKAPRHQIPLRRRWEIGLFFVFYFLLVMPAILMVIYVFNFSQDGLFSAIQWVLAIESAVFGLVCLGYAESLKSAHGAVPRWLHIN